MAGVEHAEDSGSERLSSASKRTGGEPESTAHSLLAMQRSAGNAAVGRLLGGRKPAVQRSAIAATLQSRAADRIAAATAPATAAGPEGTQAPAPDPAAMAAEKAKQRAALAGTVQPPDTTAGREQTRGAAAAVKAEAAAPATPAAGGKDTAPPSATGGDSDATAAVASAAQLTQQAVAQADAEAAPEPPAPVRPPEPVPAADAAGRAVPGDPAADALAAGLAARLQALRTGAHAVRTQAARERAQAHRIQALLHSAEGGVTEAEAGVARLEGHTAHRREVAGQARQALEVSKQKQETVAAGAPQVSAQSDDGKAKSSPMAAESKQLAAENASKQPEDAEAAGKSAEQGSKLTKVGADLGSIDDAIGATKTRAGRLAEEATQAQQANTAAQGRISSTEQALERTGQKTAEMTGQNQAARARLAGLAGGPADQRAGADDLDAQARTLDEASARLELRVHAARQSYADGMASMPARVPRRSAHQVQRAGYDDRARFDPAGAVAGAVPSWLSGEEPQSARARAEHKAAEDARRRAELAEIDREAGGHFERLSAADKAGIALKMTGRHLFSSVGATNFPRFIGNIARGFIDPRMSLMGIVQGFGMIASGGANLFSAAQWAKDPVGNLLKSAADITTGVTIVLGSIAGLATAIAIILTAVAIVGSIFSFGAAGVALAPIIAFCGTVAATVAPWALEAAAIALTLHGLVFIKNLVDAASAQTAGQLQNESDQMTEDATNAGAMALQIGMAKAMEAGGKLLAGARGGRGGGGGGGEGGGAGGGGEGLVTEGGAVPESGAVTEGGPVPESGAVPEGGPVPESESGPAPEPAAAPEPASAPESAPAADTGPAPAAPEPVELPSGIAANDNAIPQPDLPGGPAANDNAIPPSEANEQVLAGTGTDGPVDVGPKPPELRVIEGGASSDAPRAMAGADKPGPGSRATPATTVEGPGAGRPSSVGGPAETPSSPTTEPTTAEPAVEEPTRELTEDEKWEQMTKALESETEPESGIDADAEAEGERDVAAEAGRREHAKQRQAQARQGDAGRQVGRAQEVIANGDKFTDSATGNTVHVLGDRVVITGPHGEPVTQFTNTRANTRARVAEGKWVPKND
ncbi:hypothetical protein ACFVYA_02815 [Amycolatopsis sp. NPDC058278]|uniref:hypothetical protein n=1 Tax=Amycolatopsis sp. NPDC058278 TaxID=3346417 RepID=UPI0036DEBBAA